MNRLVLASASLLLGACSSGANNNGGLAGNGSVGVGVGNGGAGGPLTSGGGNVAGSAGGTSPTGTPAAGSPGSSGGTSGGGTSPSGGSPEAGGGVMAGGTSAAGTSAGGTSAAGTSAGGTNAAGTSAGGTNAAGTSAGGAGGAAPSICPYTPPEDPATFPDNWTRGEVTQFNENGGWTWYNDERVVVDAAAGKIIVSSAASSASSQTSQNHVDVVIHDLATGQNVEQALGTLSYSDDHNNGGIVIKAPGEYWVGWAHHNVDCNSYYRNYANGAWGNAVTYAWGEGCPWGTRPDNITYNNPWKMSAENVYYNIQRSVETSPGILVSDDEGATWTYRGRLTASAQQGYNAGYYKFWGNGVDRIDFFATEAHPRDADTSVYHGYIQGGKTYDSFGEEKDDNLFDGNAPGIVEFTRVFAAGTTIGGATLNALWNFDIARYDDGTIGVLWQGRVGARGKDNTNPQHRIAYSRFNGTAWVSTYLVRAGRTLYRDQSDWWEEDYLGGAALDPDDPHVIYVSTPIDPRDDSTDLGNHEIWKGVTCDDGASFQWSPMTMNSAHENLRPVVPKWNAQNTALLWFRGNYQTAQMFDAEVVGIISQPE